MAHADVNIPSFAAAPCALDPMVEALQAGIRAHNRTIAALAAIAAWQAAAPGDAAAGGTRLSGLLVLSWRDLLHWQIGAILAGLALAPAIWICKTRVRRLSGNQQLGVNLTGVLAAIAVLAPSGFLLFRGVV